MKWLRKLAAKVFNLETPEEHWYRAINSEVTRLDGEVAHWKARALAECQAVNRLLIALGNANARARKLEQENDL